MWYVKKIRALLKRQKRNEYFFQTFHHSCKDLIVLAQCLGLFPLSDVRHIETKKLKFKWLSFKMLYSVLLFVLILLCSATSIYKAFSRNTVFYNLVTPLFNVHINITLILFIIMSKRWSTFLCKITAMEKSFVKKYRSKNSMRRKINIFIIVSNISVTAAQALSLINFILTRNSNNNAITLEHYLRQQFHYIFEYFPYNTAFGIVLLVVHWIGLYVWNYGDVFIISMCMIMTERFNKIKNHIFVYTSVILTPERRILKTIPIDVQNMDLKFWREIRRDYAIMSAMCRKLNKFISNIVLINTAFNLTFVLFQLFNGLSRKEKFTQRLYFHFRFVYVALRIFFVSVFGGWLHESGRAAIPLLNALPTEVYNEENFTRKLLLFTVLFRLRRNCYFTEDVQVEISRLIHQMHYNSPCFTGKDFFKVTKGLILSITAAIITYELVLLQFSPSTYK